MPFESVLNVGAIDPFLIERQLIGMVRYAYHRPKVSVTLNPQAVVRPIASQVDSQHVPRSSVVYPINYSGAVRRTSNDHFDACVDNFNECCEPLRASCDNGLTALGRCCGDCCETLRESCGDCPGTLRTCCCFLNFCNLRCVVVVCGVLISIDVLIFVIYAAVKISGVLWGFSVSPQQTSWTFGK